MTQTIAPANSIDHSKIIASPSPKINAPPIPMIRAIKLGGL